MGLFSRLTKLATLPETLATVRYGSPWADSTHLAVVSAPEIPEGPVTRDEAMLVPALIRARNLICTTIARIPLIADSEIAPAWMTNATPSVGQPQTLFARMLWTADDLFFSGRSLWAVERDHSGEITTAIHVPIALWDYDNEGNILFDGQPCNPAEVITFDGIHAGILAHGGPAIRDALKLNRAAARVGDNPAALTELRQTNDALLSDEEIDKLIARYQLARQGKNGKVSYSSPGIEVIEHTQAKENLLIEGRNAATVDIARLANLPAPFIDATVGGTSLSYENAASRLTELTAFGLSPILAAISARLNMPDLTPYGLTVSFDTDKILEDIPALAPVETNNAIPVVPATPVGDEQ